MTGVLAEGAHWGSVIAAYGVTALVLGALTVYSIAESRRARRELERLDRRDEEELR